MDNEKSPSDSDWPAGPNESQTDDMQAGKLQTEDPIVDILEPAPKRKRGVGLGVVFFMSFVAALAGAAGGGALSRVLDQDVATKPAANMQSGLTAVNETANAIKARLVTLETKWESSDVPALIADLDARLSAIEARPVVTETGTVIDPEMTRRLEALEAAPQPDVSALSDIETRLATLEASLGPDGGTQATALDPALLERLEALENQETPTDPVLLERLTALENAEPPVMPDPVDLTPLMSRLEALENRAATLKAEIDKAAQERAAIPLPPFPREEVVAAMSAVTDDDKGWLGRTLGKHVRVRDESLILIVDDIEALVLQGEARAALARVNDLPEEGRAAAQSWVEAVKAQRTSL